MRPTRKVILKCLLAGFMAVSFIAMFGSIGGWAGDIAAMLLWPPDAFMRKLPLVVQDFGFLVVILGSILQYALVALVIWRVFFAQRPFPRQ